ncbi:Rid family hydrolase [Ramlibacter humi]|uniref:RidA family protein n=1 Tax=Ramlibacter humi TaxID=2530451 RepID=A0A4Z0BBR0_9BURK|nr:Rid family hydrolase [Ramlibacter humi]TFY96602.1 RidA family protein [Ramlibacter humi]
MNPELHAYPLPGRSTFSAAVRAGPLLFVSGMTAVDEQRRIVGDDLAGQARFIYGKLAAVLAQAGATLADVIETVEYVTTFDGYDKTADVRREVFGGGPYPAATGVKVSELVRPGALIEIRATAWLGNRA